MNAKITKLRADNARDREKIASLQAKCKKRDQQIRELENTEIIGLVRETGMTINGSGSIIRARALRLIHDIGFVESQASATDARLTGSEQLASALTEETLAVQLSPIHQHLINFRHLGCVREQTCVS